MTILGIMLGAGVLLFLAGRYYAPLIGRALGERADRPTPAVLLNDGRDYVPTKTPVVFAHHYASIAGAGPIIGPVLAIYYGWGPALLWVVIGGIFLGAVHDYVATHIAVREGGKNLAVITRRYIGQSAFVMMLVMLVALLVLVCAAFLDLSAQALSSTVALKDLQLADEQTLFRVVDNKAVIGGIASTSVVVITAFSPLIGFLYLKRKTPVWLCSLMALVICGLSIFIGLYFPMQLSSDPERNQLIWKLMISGYVLISAGLPVWLFLQSRDFINVHILYVGIAFLIVALFAAGLRGGGELAGGDSALPMNNWSDASERLGPGWPVLFIMIACGAVSGFHSLCAGGTTCKQLNSEPAARRVGYFGMLLESFLAVCVICAMLVGLSFASYQGYCYPLEGKGNAVLTFAVSVGRTAHAGLGMPIAWGTLGGMLLLEGFLVTTLDTAIRLTRYMIEEGWATFFRRYDIFAEAGRASEPRPDETRGATELVGTGGLSVEKSTVTYVGDVDLPTTPIPTSGALRFGFRILKQYWVNSGIAVGLMLLLGLGNGYNTVWKIFGSSNQLLAALALIVATCWLVARQRPIWYTLLPALFMLVTAVTALIRELVTKYIPGWPGTAPLAVTAIVVLIMTAGIVIFALKRWVASGRTAASPVK
ncbi:MAG: carbon starvation CstA family protein [Planctomycetota bacterium]